MTKRAPAPLPPLTLAEVKARSEQALPILRRHFAGQIPGDVFLAEAGESYHGLVVACGSPHPLVGTPMIGGMSGYYEPEWDEDTAYTVLGSILQWTDKPDSMSDAEWVEALAVVRMTPASHAARMVEFERDVADLDAMAERGVRPTEDTSGRAA